MDIYTQKRFKTFKVALLYFRKDFNQKGLEQREENKIKKWQRTD